MNAPLSRRALLGGAGALAAALATGAAQARILPKDMVPLIGPGYRAVDQDEKGLWQLMERVEEEVSGSNLLIKDDGADSAISGTSSATSAGRRPRTCASIWRAFPNSTR